MYLASNASELMLGGLLVPCQSQHTVRHEEDVCMNCLILFTVHLTFPIFFLSTCMPASNRPEPVLWTKDGAELPDPDRMVVSGRELNILFLNKTDNGTYRCEATNTIGQSSAEYVLIVHGKFFRKTLTCERKKNGSNLSKSSNLSKLVRKIS